MLDWLLKAQYAVAALVAVNVVLTARSALSGGRGSDVWIALGLLALCGGCAAAAWWLQSMAHPRAALLVLLGFWALVVISAVIAASQARWN